MKSIKDLINLGSDIAGSATGALVGLGLAGPPGAVAGAITGPIIGKTIKKIGDEVANRVLSQNEQKRIGAVLIYAGQKIDENKKTATLCTNLCVLKRVSFYDHFVGLKFYGVE